MNCTQFETTIEFRLGDYYAGSRVFESRLIHALEDSYYLNHIAMMTKIEDIQIIETKREVDPFSVFSNSTVDILKVSIVAKYIDRSKERWEWIDHRRIKQSIRYLIDMINDEHGTDFYRFSFDESRMFRIEHEESQTTIQQEANDFLNDQASALREASGKIEISKEVINKPSKKKIKPAILEREIVIL